MFYQNVVLIHTHETAPQAFDLPALPVPCFYNGELRHQSIDKTAHQVEFRSPTDQKHSAETG